MRVCAAIRTNKWGEDETRLWAALAPVFGDDLTVVYHDYDGEALPCHPIETSDDWVVTHNLADLADWGWRCGDYAYYALRQGRPDYDYYWLIEPDVHFTGMATDFFARFGAETADALGYQLAPFDESHPFARQLDVPSMRAIFALTRLSGRALDRLLPLRQAYSQRGIRQRRFANDELFVFSHVVADPELTTQRLETHAADWFEGGQFDTNPDLLLDVVEETFAGQAKLLHPVRARTSFKSALATRLAANTNFLGKMGPALASLNDEDLHEVAGLAARRLHASLISNRSR